MKASKINSTRNTLPVKPIFKLTQNKSIPRYVFYRFQFFQIDNFVFLTIDQCVTRLTTSPSIYRLTNHVRQLFSNGTTLLSVPEKKNIFVLFFEMCRLFVCENNIFCLYSTAIRLYDVCCQRYSMEIVTDLGLIIAVHKVCRWSTKWCVEVTKICTKA